MFRIRYQVDENGKDGWCEISKGVQWKECHYSSIKSAQLTHRLTCEDSRESCRLFIKNNQNLLLQLNQHIIINF